MLQHTFRHIKGFGAKKEAELWRAGTFTWDDYERSLGAQLPLFGDLAEEDPCSPLRDSKIAFKNGNVDFFATRLPHQEHFRIALSYPDQTMFVDIETTGLSKYYDKITLIGWSIGCEYGVCLQGDDDSRFREALASAKAIVTFNGCLFDLPFIRNELKEIALPSCHIDLRFLAKRVGLSGGQKAIEEILGIKRSTKAAEVDGEKATLLWHKYKWGDMEALRQLIIYNHADVEGMKVIFDRVVKKLTKTYKLPASRLSLPQFSKNRSRLQWAHEQTPPTTGVAIRPYVGRVGPLVFLEDLPLPKRKGFKVVGIDLTGSESRPSGWCCLDYDWAETKCIGSDEDLINETLKAKPDLVSIDSPLSIPAGRVSVGDDDPGRHEFGIMRYCERLLKKRGVNVYPSLIPSMQQLTARGMRLADQFRKLGVPVIESYPGAAQDIMGIPRKGASLEYLAKGLELFGIRGGFLSQKVTHDELDAITSAVVGLFFWCGKFEAIGNDKEEYLIIPDLQVDPSRWLERRVIGLSGAIASGKTTAGHFLRRRGFAYGRFSQILQQMLVAEGKAPTREALQELGEKVNKNEGQRWLGWQLFRMFDSEMNIAIDGLRHLEDHAFLVETFGPGFTHIHIDSLLIIRQERYVNDKNKAEDFERAISHPVEAGVNALSALAHHTVTNNKDLPSFERIIVDLSGSCKYMEGKVACL